ncbi:cyclic nucleotide-binding domain-containing protein [Desulfosoma caldarium]|uniref:Putative methyltransferase n=1 Tax=Desulfosoma caldarium TaxID=610254 RepID=A0A3N1VSJ3_9BACT|nr:cyclic nucleotide-binding domain-containing protein [Desulfosoma caldarium]ROR03192.1 putative methyltransferase [Desulfosoma caldarium]
MQTIQGMWPTIGRKVVYGKGEQIFLQGAKQRCLYYVEQGAVEVAFGQNGTTIAVAYIGPGEFLGETGFFDGASRVRNVRAAEPTVLRIYDWASMEALRSRDPHSYALFITDVARSVCAKFRRVLDEREPLTAYAASLSTGRRQFHEARPVPGHFFRTPLGGSIVELVEKTKADLFDLSYAVQSIGKDGELNGLQERCTSIMNHLNENLQDMEPLIAQSDFQDVVWGYIFKEVFPYLMRSRFAERAYYKPKGYAGDYLMMEMIYRHEPSGDGKLGFLVDAWCLNAPASRAVRGRRSLLAEELKRRVLERTHTSDPIRILNLACGPSRELFDFLKSCPETHRVEATLMDADVEALHYTNTAVNTFPHRATIRYLNDNAVRWALGRTRQELAPQDIIYSAGLTDYLDRRLFTALVRRCYEQLKPEGCLIIGNFSPQNPNRAIMDHILQWKLIYRTEKDLRNIFAETPFGHRVSCLCEPEGINLFAVAYRGSENGPRKSDSATSSRGTN